MTIHFSGQVTDITPEPEPPADVPDPISPDPSDDMGTTDPSTPAPSWFRSFLQALIAWLTAWLR